jgi:hypothetical protein
MSTIIQQNQRIFRADKSKPLRIPVYQTCEKAQHMNMFSINNKPHRPTYHNMHSLPAIIENLTDQQTGIIIGKDPSRCHALFCQFSYEIKRISLNEEDVNSQNVSGKQPKFIKPCISRYVSNTGVNGKSSRKLIWINLPEKGPLKISELQSIVQVQLDAGVAVEWISIIQHPSHQHLFKWELIC